MNHIGKTVFTVLCIFFILSTTSCKKDYICPAYQSYFLLDSTKRAHYFSLFSEDSIPKMIVEVSKSKVGIMEKTSYKKKSNSMQTLPMTIIYPELSDSAIQKSDSLDYMISNKDTLIN